MAYSINELDGDPKPDKGDCGVPLSSYRPNEAPQSKRYERDIENDEAAREILGDQATHGSSGRKHVIKVADVLLD
ncbi:MAG TPA: hypothetical protein VNX02_13605 [Steroidobacteraceae bacterium]|jgi:hypothetical protein|nr:hypothetical protein [Steroidobacteraceae bacterium]